MTAETLENAKPDELAALSLDAKAVLSSYFAAQEAMKKAMKTLLSLGFHIEVTSGAIDESFSLSDDNGGCDDFHCYPIITAYDFQFKNSLTLDRDWETSI